eukprot:TRINITY_DN1501_c0_g2_i4.p1 TRINITY_DN1501_c0_g2~~TRINITY_DN1501_c0_g2_i4.p1  ORF type:complete len:345 (+),score=57.91 TRINITY_DN1501_c0_g2_i4:119-1036(+)
MPAAEPKKKLKTITVEVLQGRNLAAKDRNGLSDPYVVLKVDSRFTILKQTKIIKKTLEPVWTEKFVFEVPTLNGRLSVSCWDWDRLTKDDHMGSFSVDLRPFKEGGVFDDWYKLNPLDPREVVSGDIRLRITYNRDDPGTKELTPQDFELLRVVGRGHFGKVMQVRKKSDNAIYAMKVLHKSEIVEQGDVEQTHSEKRLLQFLSHPFLVNLRYAFQSDANLYLVMDFVAGGELFQQMQASPCFDETRAKFYAAEVVLVLEYLHKHNVAYRDLKPENILIDCDGQIGKSTRLNSSHIPLSRMPSSA